jgi:dipeptidyl aminopeptidase/acylaminoacyl peptidase
VRPKSNVDFDALAKSVINNMNTPIRFLCSFLLFFIAVPAGYSQTGIKELLSYPYPSNLCSHPVSGKLAWSFNQEGKRNIFLSNDHGKSYKSVTQSATDDGQIISQLQFTPDGEWLIYMKGGEPGGNWSAELPANPASLTEKTDFELRSICLKDNVSKVLATGQSSGSVSISPDSRQVAFVKNGAVWTVPTDGSEKAKQLFFARGTNREMKWSPDGRSLLFISDRGGYSFVGIYAADQSSIKWLDPSFSKDVSPVWSPDSKSVAFIRLQADGGGPDSLLQQLPVTWQIRIGRADSTGSKLLWESPQTKRGSVPTTHGKYNLNWAANNRIVFLSSQDNWPHLYSVSAHGGTPLLLTPGDFMVEYIQLSPDKKQLIFSANHGTDHLDIDRRHIGIVSVDKPDMKMLTSGEGIEAFPVFLQNGAIGYIGSTPYRPAMPTILQPGKKPQLIGLELLADHHSEKNLIKPKQVVFSAPDGTLIHGQLFNKEQKVKKKRPAVLYIHGGPMRQMLLGWHYSDYYAANYAINQMLAKMGFVVLSVNYRLGIGYGHDFHNPRSGGRSGASEYQDIKAAGKWLASLAEVDQTKIGVYGGSYGGYLTALALGKDSDLFAAGVDIHGVHTRLPQEKFTTPFEAAADAELADSVAWQSSPIAHVHSWRSPVLIIHGDDDRNVGFGHSLNLINRLRKKGVEYETIVIPDDTHHWLLHKNLVTVCEATIEFLERKLMKD